MRAALASASVVRGSDNAYQSSSNAERLLPTCFDLYRYRGQNQMHKTSSLMVHLDEESNAMLTAAAELRRISVSDYVRSVVVGQAERELATAESHTIGMTPDEQLEFWNAFSKPPKLTKAQEDLGTMMRGDS
ncbi:DUF1778 domain-containing protein [Rhodopirellula europaea]|uniref:type II toxin -antitoxin system TacA 1-like antitoxin n=2 Tax=Rhodopirellula TaxID=265488 RepID=UPI0030EE9CC9